MVVVVVVAAAVVLVVVGLLLLLLQLQLLLLEGWVVLVCVASPGGVFRACFLMVLFVEGRCLTIMAAGVRTVWRGGYGDGSHTLRRKARDLAGNGDGEAVTRDEVDGDDESGRKNRMLPVTTLVVVCCLW